MSNKSGAGKFVLGAFIGATIGAIGGLLFAPKSGKETRADIAKKAGEAKDFTVEKANQVKHFATEKTKHWKDHLFNRGHDDKESSGKSAKE